MIKKKPRRLVPTTVLLPRRVDRCPQCEGGLRWRISTSSRPHPFRDFGFPVDIVGLPVAACSRCRNQLAAAGNPERFRRAILEQILVKPGPLSCDEIHFLRKTLDMTGGIFAGLVGVSREHISHIEQGHAPNLGTAADRLARLMIAAKTDPSLQLMKRLLGNLDENVGTRSKRKTTRHRGYRVTLGTRRS
jgi:DNA-binding transcriptional regulator YiaG